MATSTDPGSATGATGVDRLGFEDGQLVQEFGYADDVDHDVRDAIADLTGADLADEDFDDVVDGAIVWFRDGEGEDLTDTLVDVQTVLDDGAPIWVITPKPGRRGHVGHNDIQEAATTAGLHATSTFSLAEDWSATKLGTRGRGR